VVGSVWAVNCGVATAISIPFVTSVATTFIATFVMAIEWVDIEEESRWSGVGVWVSQGVEKPHQIVAEKKRCCVCTTPIAT
jgi:hypothetical protein